MSLIEKALNKSSEEIKSPSSESPPPVPDPRNIVSVQPSMRKYVYLGLGGIILLLALTLSLWLFFATPGEFNPPPPSRLQASNQTGTAPVASPVTADAPSPPTEKPVAGEGTAGVAVEQQETSQDDTAPLAAGTQTEPAAPVREPEKEEAVRIPQSPSRPSSMSQGFSRDEGAEDLVNKAYVYSQTGKYAQAVRCYDQVLAGDPLQYEALLNRGIIKQQRGNSKGAETDLLAAHRIQPEDPVLLNALGVLYLQSGNEDEAKSFLLSAGDATSKINLALYYWKHGEYENVIASLQQAAREDSQNPYAPYYLGLFYRQMRDHPSAHHQFETAITIARKRGLTDLIHNIESLSLGP